MVRIEPTIIRNLIENEEYARKVVPYLKSEYFLEPGEAATFQQIVDFYRLYNKRPTIEAIKIELGQLRTLSEHSLKSSQNLLNDIKATPEQAPDEKWLVKKTEEFCQDKAIYLAMRESLEIADGRSKKGKGAIPDLLKDALSITFDPRVGHNYIEDADARFTYYTNVEEKVPFDLELLNKATNGGVGSKRLHVILGGVHTGKTAIMCSLAASNLLKGKNVLYITLEMSEEEISRRIDCNLLDIPIKELDKLPQQFFMQKINALKAKVQGTLIVKEYPTSNAGVNHFRALLNDLNLKKGFRPDVIFVDYLNLCTSTRFKNPQDLYGYVKSIAEELRGLAVEFDLPIWSATQLNRGGMKNTDPDMTDTAESIGLPATVDLLWAIIRSPDLDKKGYLVLKQLKNRYADLLEIPRFLIGLDRTKMRLFDVNDAEQTLAKDPDQIPMPSVAKPIITLNNGPQQVWNLEE